MFTHCYCAPVHTHDLITYIYTVFNDTDERVRIQILVRNRRGVVLSQSHFREIPAQHTAHYDLKDVPDIENAIVEVILFYPKEPNRDSFSLDIPQGGRSIRVTEIISRGTRGEFKLPSDF